MRGDLPTLSACNVPIPGLLQRFDLLPGCVYGLHWRRWHLWRRLRGLLWYYDVRQLMRVRPVLMQLKVVEIPLQTAANVYRASIVRVRTALMQVVPVETISRTAVVIYGMP